MGYLKEMYGFELIGSAPEGTCPVCATEHDPELPHNQQSLAYKYRFYDEHGRWPTWYDAMWHCRSDVRELWLRALEDIGVDVGESPDEAAVLTISVCQNPAKIDPFWEEAGSELTRDGGGFPGGPGEPRGV